MKFKSTRGRAPLLSFSEALFAGLAPDGGLYIPETLPLFTEKRFSSSPSIVEVGIQVISAFLEEGVLKEEISLICQNAFNFPILLTKLNDTISCLELYHGPTAAFKDVGARFLAQAISRLSKKQSTILVATSGDTGGAVAGAFHGMPGINVVILYPKGMVSAFQEKQLTGWGGNIQAFKVRGSFDDCQRLAKEAFLSPDWKEENLLSANSINIGRILPQSVYYAWASLEYFKKTGRKPGFVIPTGNLGNGLAALWAKKMGFPMEKIVFASNANLPVVDYFKAGKLTPRSTITTLANAMDVGNPSNLERLQALYPNLDDLKKEADSFSVTDDEIRQEIKDVYRNFDKILCPHTATASFVTHRLQGKDWIIVATAHAAKFRSAVEPIIKKAIMAPPALEGFEKLTGQSVEIEASLESLAKALSEP